MMNIRLSNEEFIKAIRDATGRVIDKNVFEIIDGAAIAIVTTGGESHSIVFELWSSEDVDEFVSENIAAAHAA
jgi:hypothetical protein